jgi:putative N6-adenine-specific DNA methylase
MTDPQFKFFVSCSPGIEPILSGECQGLGLTWSQETQPDMSSSAGEEPGGILLWGSLLDVYRCNLHLRTASRVSVRLGSFHAVSFAELRKKAARLEWSRFIHPGQALNISVTCHKSRLYHSDAVAERVLGAVNDSFASQKTGSKPCILGKHGVLVLVRLVNDLCTISIDSSGELLHKRGYRQETAKAPLRETLAAAMLLASGWNGSIPLIDPFCGSGTIPIEAALLSSHIPPGINREFAFMRWPGFERDQWQNLLSIARKEIIPPTTLISGYDRDAGAITIASSNAARAGQKDVILFIQQPISALTASETPGWIIANPPYGLRVTSGRDLRDLYARFGEILRVNFTGWQAGILVSDPRLGGNLGLPVPQLTFRFINGGIPVKYQLFQL